MKEKIHATLWKFKNKKSVKYTEFNVGYHDACDDPNQWAFLLHHSRDGSRYVICIYILSVTRLVFLDVWEN